MRLSKSLAVALAKVRVAEYLSTRRKGTIPPAVASLSRGSYTVATYNLCRKLGLVRWDNGSVLTDEGAASLAKFLGRSTRKVR